MKKPRRYKPSVSLTIKVSWTTAEAKRFHKQFMKTAGWKPNDGSGCWTPLKDFEEALLDETNLEDFLRNSHGQTNWEWLDSNPEPYFIFVLDSL